MIRLHHSVEIDRRPEVVYDALLRMPEHYVRWHRHHVACRSEPPGPLAVGSVVVIEELLHGQPRRLRLRVTHLRPPRRIAYRIGPGMHGTFVLHSAHASAQRTRFVATLSFGIRWPLLGPLLDRMLLTLFRARFEAIRTHMREEDEGLKALLENAPPGGVRSRLPSGEEGAAAAPQAE